MALAVALLVGAAACHKDNQEARLKALDNAYKSGVFTKEEYDAKKQALVGPSAAAPLSTPTPAPAPAPPGEPPDTSSPPPAAQVAPPVAATQPPAQVPPPSAPHLPTLPSPKAAPPPAAEPDEPEPAPLAGCHDAETRAGGPKGVQERFFPASEEAVRRAAGLAFTNLDFAIHRDSGHEMEASKRRHLSAVVGAGGERLILHFSSERKDGQAGTRVTGETKKSIVGRLAQRSWTSAVLAQIACNLRTAKQ